MDSRLIAELVVRLGRIASGEGLVEGLTTAQWTVLRYLARANRFSRTPSAFAEFHGTTRGTASQTIKSLVARGYLAQTRSAADGRSTRLDLTDRARAMLLGDPFDAIVRAADALPPGVRGQFASTLQRIVGQVALGKGRPPFGTCISCENLEGDGSCQEARAPYICGFADEPVDFQELEQLCINFIQKKSSAARRPAGGTVSR